MFKEIKSRLQDVQASEEALTKRRFSANRKIRIRRVKCDEKQPICGRCKSFGVVCDGYPQMLKNHVVDLTLGRWLKLLPKPQIMEPRIKNPFDSDKDQRYFTLFQNRVSQADPFSDSETWRRLILQSSHVPAIRHGIIAIGALEKASVTARMVHSRSLARIDSAQVHHHMAMESYAKAIRSMKNAVASGGQDLRTTLLTCLVIACFEAFNGQYFMAHKQIVTAMGLIFEWRADFVTNVPLGYGSPKPYEIEDDLIQSISRLEIQTVGSSNSKPAEHHATIRRESDEIIRDLPSIFETLESAQVYLELLLRRVEYLAYMIGGVLTPKAAQTEYQSQILVEVSESTSLTQDFEMKSRGVKFFNNVAKMKGLQLLELHKWEAAFNMMMSRPGIQETTASKVLRIHSMIAITMTKGMNRDFEALDTITDYMERIVDLAEDLLVHWDSTGAPKFSLDSRVVLPLYMTALKCQNSDIRRRIIDLLFKFPRREGIWDSLLVGKTLVFVQSIEEEFMVDGSIPAWYRALDVRVHTVPQEQKAYIHCRQQNSCDERSGVRERTEVVNYQLEMW